MCGISGIINKKEKHISYQDIKSMNDLIVHRGPDGEGFFFGENFALGHRRLAIVDLSPDGHQPMHYQEKYSLIYNGEIYNYIEIKNELLQYGFTFNSKTDTEVILAAYAKWGVDCIKKFNGMWAFCLYDKEKELLFCSRDRFGVKPFYYSNTEDIFIFGSEIKQIIGSKYIEAVANVHSITDFLIEGYSDHSNETFFNGIFKIKPGHNLIYSLAKHSIEEYEYYSLKVNDNLSSLDENKVIEYFLLEFERSIKYRLRADVKVGTCLSGGLDSSSIVAIASKIYNKTSETKFQAIHAKSSEERTDESQYAKELAENCSTDIFIVEPTIDEFQKYIAEVVYCQEEPFGSPSIFMQFFVFKKAKEMNCKVMLDGQGGDEVLLGYERYYPAYLFSLPFFDRFKAFFRSSKNSKLTLTELLFYILYFSFPAIRISKIKQKFSFLKNEYLKDFTHVKEFSNAYLNLQNLQKLEINSLQLPHLLRYEDKNSMWHSIETRLPFLDYKIVEMLLSINNSLKIKNGWTKYILRKSMTGLISKNILWRKHKFGFEAPEAIWIRNIQEDMNLTISKSALLNKICKKEINFNSIDLKIYWRLYSIAKWEHIFKVKL